MTPKQKALTQGEPGWVTRVVRANLAARHHQSVRLANVVLPHRRSRTSRLD